MRPFAEVRKHLLLQRFYDRVLQMGKQSVKSLGQNDIQLVRVESRELDFFVEFKFRQRTYQATYPYTMLDAEVNGWFMHGFHALNEIQKTDQVAGE